MASTNGDGRLGVDRNPTGGTSNFSDTDRDKDALAKACINELPLMFSVDLYFLNTTGDGSSANGDDSGLAWDTAYFCGVVCHDITGADGAGCRSFLRGLWVGVDFIPYFGLFQKKNQQVNRRCLLHSMNSYLRGLDHF